MPEAVIVATSRSPIGRARKGSLADLRPDDLAAQIVAAPEQIPELDREHITDLHMGCAEPQDEHGQNVARRVAVQLGLDGLPGTAVNRFCASSVRTARMAFHAVKAGEGHAFTSAGVECVSRYRRGDPHLNPLFDEARERTQRTAEANEPWHDPRDDGKLPDCYIAMGQTAENVAATLGISRRDQDEFGVRSHNLAEKAIADGFFGLETMCVGGGQGMAIILERLS